MKEYELAEDFTYQDKGYEWIGRDYSEVEGSEELRNHFKILRTGGVLSPFRQFDWDVDKWFVSAGDMSGFYLTKSEARFITFVELYYNLALSHRRARIAQREWERARANMDRSDELKENGI